jgi:hypothetical protein
MTWRATSARPYTEKARLWEYKYLTDKEALKQTISYSCPIQFKYGDGEVTAGPYRLHTRPVLLAIMRVCCSRLIEEPRMGGGGV